jgi:hypothetical protein
MTTVKIDTMCGSGGGGGCIPPAAPVLGAPTVSGNTVTVPVASCASGALVTVTASNGTQVAVVCGISAVFTDMPTGAVSFTATQAVVSGCNSAASAPVSTTVTAVASPLTIACQAGIPAADGSVELRGTITGTLVPGSMMLFHYGPDQVNWANTFLVPAANGVVAATVAGLPLNVPTYYELIVIPPTGPGYNSSLLPVGTSGLPCSVTPAITGSGKVITCLPATAGAAGTATLRGSISGTIPPGDTMFFHWSTDGTNWTNTAQVTAVLGNYAQVVTGLPAGPIYYEFIVYDPANNNGINSSQSGSPGGPCSVVVS